MLSRRKLLQCASLTALLVGSPDNASAWIHGAPTGATGKMVVNAGNSASYFYKNMALNNAGFNGTSTEAWPGLLDTNQYPFANPVNNVSINTRSPTYSGNWVVSFLGIGDVAIGSASTTISDPNSCIVAFGGNTRIKSNVASVATTTGAIAGTTMTLASVASGTVAIGNPVIGVGVTPGTVITAGSGLSWTVNISQTVSSTTLLCGQTRVVINFTSPGTAYNLFIPGGTTAYSNLGGAAPNQMSSMFGLIFCRASAPYGNGGATKSGDEVDIESRDLSRMFNPDSLAIHATLNPKVLRFMGYLGTNFSSQSQANTQHTVNSMTFGDRWDPTNWAGAIGGTNGIYSCSAPPAVSSLVDGVQVQGTFTNAQQATISPSAVSNTSSTVTFTVPSTANLTTGNNLFVQVPGLNDTILSSQNNGLFTVYPMTVIDGTHVSIATTGTFSGSYTSGAAIVAQPTLAVGGLGAKPVLMSYGLAPGFFAGGAITANQFATLTYDAVIQGGAWIVGATTAMSGNIPIAVIVALCNKLNKDLWWTFPHMMTTTAALVQAAYIRDNLRSGLNAYFEYGNENWNNAFTQAHYVVQKGVAYGFGTANNANSDAAQFWGLRVAQIMSGIGALWSGGVGLQRVYATQFGNTSTSNLTLTKAAAGVSQPYWSTFSGGIDYSNAVGTLPYIEHFSHAPYMHGSQTQAFWPYTITGPAAISGLTTAADNYAAGGAGIATALAWLDNDIRLGTLQPLTPTSLSGAGLFTMGATLTSLRVFNNDQILLTGTLPNELSATTLYFVVLANDAAGTFKLSTSRGGTAITSLTGTLTGTLVGQCVGLPLVVLNYTQGLYNTFATTWGKFVVCYEGGQESWYPLAADCTSMGISTTYSQKILNMVVGYQQSALFKQTTLDQMNGFMGFSRSKLPCQLQIVGENQWSLLQGFVSPPTSGVNSTFAGDIFCVTNTSWDACVQFNS